jgi:hypothetical protein
MLCGVAVSVWSKQLTTLGAWLLVDGTRSLRNGGVQVRCVDGFGYCESKSEYKPHVSMGMPLAILYSSKARPGVSLTAISTSFREDSPAIPDQCGKWTRRPLGKLLGNQGYQDADRGLEQTSAVRDI